MATAATSADFTVAVSAPGAPGAAISAAVQYRAATGATPMVIIAVANPETGRPVLTSVDLATAKRISDELGAAVMTAQKLANRASRILDQADG